MQSGGDTRDFPASFLPGLLFHAKAQRISQSREGKVEIVDKVDKVYRVYTVYKVAHRVVPGMIQKFSNRMVLFLRRQNHSGERTLNIEH